MKEVLQLDEIGFVAGSQFSGKFSGAPFNSLTVDLQGQVDTGGTVTTALAGAHSLIQSYELKQGQDTLVSVAGPELKFLADADEAHAQALNPTSASSTDEIYKATCRLDFARLGPVGTLIDAGLGNAELYQTGRFGAYADASVGWSTPTSSRPGTLRASVETIARIPASGYFRPQIASRIIDLGAGASSKRTHKFQVDGPEGGVLMGFIVRAYDASAVATSISAASSDTLIRRVAAKANARRFTGDLATMTWGQGKRFASQFLGTKRSAQGILPVGVTFLPTIDDAGPAALKGGMALAQGDVIEVVVDTKSDVEEEFGAVAGTTVAAGDQAIVTPLFFQRVTPSGAPSTVLAGGAAAATGVQPRGRRRRRGR